MRALFCVLGAGMLAALAGCHGHVSSRTTLAGMDFDQDTVVLRRSGGPAAHITADGRFIVGDAPVAVTAQQQAQLVTFYGAAQQLKQHGIETGKAGAAVGLTAAHEALDGIAKGDTSQIGAKVEAQADQVRIAAGRICDDLANLRQTQEALAASLEAFRPYASVSADDATSCERDTRPKAAGSPAP